MTTLRDLNTKIPGANSFTYKEFIKSDTAIRYGIINEPNEKQWQNIEKLAVKVLQPIRNKFGGIKITSGFRTPELCLKIGSSINSNHTKGEAADIEPTTNVSLIQILQWICNNLEYRELIFEYPPDGWIHVSYREGENIKELKLKDINHNYQRVDLDYIFRIYS